MREIDRVAVDEFGLALLSMMENAGRALAAHAREMADGPVTVLAGGGGNGGGGLAAARHLANRDVPVAVVLDREAEAFEGAAAAQLGVLQRADLPVGVGTDAVPADASLVVDALVGYSLDGPLRGTPRELVAAVQSSGVPVLSLDVPSGVDATTGGTPGEAVTPERVLTLALPKTGLDATGELYLADIGIPAAVFRAAGVGYRNVFGEDWVRLVAEA
jgi:NAD(P)H-hydrate epimerase